METMPLNFGRLMGYLHHAISGIPDPRQASNATRYSLRDVVLAAFSVFFMQCESFLEHQRQMQSRSGRIMLRRCLAWSAYRRCHKSAMYWMELLTSCPV
jgi:hypothetical protein